MLINEDKENKETIAAATTAAPRTPTPFFVAFILWRLFGLACFMEWPLYQAWREPMVDGMPHPFRESAFPIRFIRAVISTKVMHILQNSNCMMLLWFKRANLHGGNTYGRPGQCKFLIQHARSVAPGVVYDSSQRGE